MFARIYGGWVGALVFLVTLVVLGGVGLLALVYLPWFLVPLVLTLVVVVPLIAMRRWEDRREREPERMPTDRYQT